MAQCSSIPWVRCLTGVGGKQIMLQEVSLVQGSRHTLSAVTNVVSVWVCVRDNVITLMCDLLFGLRRPTSEKEMVSWYHLVIFSMSILHGTR